MPANGQIPLDQLRAIGTPGRLEASAASSFDAMRAFASEQGRVITGTTHSNHAYRDLAEQERLFSDRYTTTFTGIDPREFRGTTFWRRKGVQSAAVPGMSNHGLGIAVDFQGLGGKNGSGFRWMSENAPAFGWSNAEGASVDEPHHWVHVGGGVQPIPTPLVREEGDEMPTLVFNGTFGFGLLDGGRLIGIGDEASVDAWSASGARRVSVSDAEYIRLARGSNSTWVLFCPPEEGGRGFAVWAGGRGVGIGDKRLVDQFLSAGAMQLTVSAADFDRLVSG